MRTLELTKWGIKADEVSGISLLLGQNALSGFKFRETSKRSRKYQQEDLTERDKALRQLKYQVIQGTQNQKLIHNKSWVAKQVKQKAEETGVKCPNDRQLKRILFQS